MFDCVYQKRIWILSGRADEAVDDPLSARDLEFDFQLVAFLSDYFPIPELVVKHPLADLYVAARLRGETGCTARGFLHP